MKKYFFYWVLCFTFVSFSAFSELPDKECAQHWEDLKLSKQDYAYVYEGQDYTEQYINLERDDCYKAWTVFIYMNADNNLTLESYADLYEMENIGSTVSVDIIVFHDSNDDTGSRYIHIFKDPEAETVSIRQRRLIAKDFLGFEDADIFSPVVKTIQEQDSGNIDTLETFLRWGLIHYPSLYQAVIVWSHGRGWSAYPTEENFLNDSTDGIFDPLEEVSNLSSSAEASEEPQGSISFDYSEESPSSITTPQLQSSLETLRWEFLEGAPFDIFASDACLMQEAEVAYQMRDEARFIIGSAASEVGSGWPYTSILRYITDHPYNEALSEEYGEGADAAFFWALDIPEKFQSSYSDFPGATNEHAPKATMTTVSFSKFKTTYHFLTFKEGLDRFGQALINYIQSVPGREGLRYDQVQSLIGKTFTYSKLSQDLYHFTILINNWIKSEREHGESYEALVLKKADIDLQDILQAMVLSQGISPYYDKVVGLGATKGVSIWLPKSNEEFDTYFEEFAMSDLYVDEDHESGLGGWARFNEYIHSKERPQRIILPRSSRD